MCHRASIVTQSMHVYLYLHANSLGNRWCRKKKKSTKDNSHNFFFISFAVAYLYLHELSFLDMSAYLSLFEEKDFSKNEKSDRE